MKVLKQGFKLYHFKCSPRREEERLTLIALHSRTLCLGEQPYLKEPNDFPNCYHIHCLSILQIIAGPGNRMIDATTLITRPV